MSRTAPVGSTLVALSAVALLSLAAAAKSTSAPVISKALLDTEPPGKNLLSFCSLTPGDELSRSQA